MNKSVTYSKVPSVGSRLAGHNESIGPLRKLDQDGKVLSEKSVKTFAPKNVKPSYGRARLALESNPLKLTGDSRNFGFNALGPHDLDAKSPYRRTHAVEVQGLQTREIYKLTRFAHRAGRKAAKSKPRLVKIA